MVVSNECEGAKNFFSCVYGSKDMALAFERNGKYNGINTT